MSDLPGSTVATGEVQTQTRILVVELARNEVRELDIQWSGILVSPADRSMIDLRGVASGHSQFMDALPASSIAVGRLAPGRCWPELKQSMLRTRTAIASPGPRFNTSNDVPARASSALFTTCFVAPEYYPLPDVSSTIQLTSRLLPNDGVQLALEAKIRFDPDVSVPVALHGRASIESNGVLVLAARTHASRSVQEWRKGDEPVVLLFIQPKVLPLDPLTDPQWSVASPVGL
jgi:hypothetical protein